MAAIVHDAEMDRTRFWQQAALGAMQAYIAACPPKSESQQQTFEYARRVSRFAFDVAEQMTEQHGPTASPALRP